jgi:hypothetical protein
MLAIFAFGFHSMGVRRSSAYQDLFELGVLTRRRKRMSLLGNILEKLGIGDGASARRPPPMTPPRGDTAPSATGAARSAPISPPPSAPGSATVDVTAQLEQRAAASSQKLNWRTSIVDLLKLLDLDSSAAARKQLATELGCPPELMNDSAQMNTWLHKAVLARVAANGGIVPKELLH